MWEGVGGGGGGGGVAERGRGQNEVYNPLSTDSEGCKPGIQAQDEEKPSPDDKPSNEINTVHYFLELQWNPS